MMSSEPLSLLRQVRRDRLIDAAEHVFQQNGFRGASMEAIARVAGVSKVTLYRYFPDKEAAFVAVAQRLIERLTTLFDAALDAEGDVISRVSGALIAKHRAVFTTVRRFPEAGDLFAAKGRLVDDLFNELEARMAARIGAVLRTAGIADADDLAHLLCAAAIGVANAADDARLERDLRMLISRLLAPDMPRASPAGDQNRIVASAP